MIEFNFDAISVASVTYMTLLGISGIILNSLAIRRAVKVRCMLTMNVGQASLNLEKITILAYLFYMIQAKKTKQNIILTNLIVCELLISCLGVPIDAVGAATKASIMTNVLCSLVAFIHTLLGNFIDFMIILENGTQQEKSPFNLKSNVKI